MKKIKLLLRPYFLVLFLFFTLGCSQNENYKSALITLKNAEISLSILPNAGGRVVSLHLRENKSIIYSDSLLWNNPFLFSDEKFTKPRFVGLGGHINWVGPQSDWWTQQNEFPELKNREAIWPPDPYIIYGDYEIVDQSASNLVISSPASEYSGVQIIKEYKINSDNTVEVVAYMKNVRQEEVKWDIWFNTRMRGYNQVYVPILDSSHLRLDYRSAPNQERMPHKITDGYFHFIPAKPADGMNEKVAKSFIYPSLNRIYAFTKDELFVIEFDRYDKSLTHPEQGMIEIYNSIKSNGSTLLELEYHSPYHTLKPGEEVSSFEKWYVSNYSGNSDVNSQISAIKAFESNRFLFLKKT